MPPKSRCHESEKEFRHRIGSKGQLFVFHPFVLSPICQKSRLDFNHLSSTIGRVNYLLLALLSLWISFCQAQDTNPVGRLPATPPPAPTNAPAAAPSDEEIITAQGIQIWKKGKPKKAYRTLGFDRLEKQKGFPAAENKIARGVLARKGNAAIINTIQNSMRVNFDLNTQDENLDGIDIRYEIILLQP